MNYSPTLRKISAKKKVKEQVTYRKWRNKRTETQHNVIGQRREDCAVMDDKSELWYTYSCQAQSGYICEQPILPGTNAVQPISSHPPPANGLAEQTATIYSIGKTDISFNAEQTTGSCDSEENKLRVKSPFTAEARRKANTKRTSIEARRKANAKRISTEARRKANAKRISTEARRKANAKRISTAARRKANAKRTSTEASRKANAKKREETVFQLMRQAAPYPLTCHGLMERFNASLKTCLHRLCCEQLRQWHWDINPLLFAYR
ncbi:Zinc finger protein [Plakobranchus ocellatus]|uniref:Zinc finger protein n=1 Tax=Plakobranchus ocellatus TaxID=259542 RepID=A0AAV4CGR4_9GAST|nr:Zinc finger protein [Plakobranchus ocellatus]